MICVTLVLNTVLNILASHTLLVQILLNIFSKYQVFHWINLLFFATTQAISYVRWKRWRRTSSMRYFWSYGKRKTSCIGSGLWRYWLPMESGLGQNASYIDIGRDSPWYPGQGDTYIWSTLLSCIWLISFKLFTS